ncbi:MAG: hypothetical protein KC549_01765, partial [Myxococcales bacterium]|nr:hypothetical protein [Myxococcales bacterium]
MRWLDFAALGVAADRLDAWAAVTDGVDRFCTSSRWALPAQRAFMPAAEPFITESDAGIIALMTVTLPDGRRVGVPLEASWGLASPFASDDPPALVAQLRQMLAADHAPESLYLSGVARSGPWFEEV